MEADSSTSADVPNRNENMMRGKQKHVLNAPNKPCMTPAVILFCNCSFAVETQVISYGRLLRQAWSGRLTVPVCVLSHEPAIPRSSSG